MSKFKELINRGRELGYANIRSWPAGTDGIDVTDLIYEQTVESIEFSELSDLVRDPAWIADVLSEKPELLDIRPNGLMPRDTTLAGMLRCAIARMIIIEIETDLLIECHKCGHLNDAGLTGWLESIHNSRELFEHNHFQQQPETASRLSP